MKTPDSEIIRMAIECNYEHGNAVLGDHAMEDLHKLEQKCITYEAQLAEKDVQLADMQHWGDRCAELEASLSNAVSADFHNDRVEKLEAENARLKDENKILERGWGNCSADRLIKTEQRDKAVGLLRESVAWMRTSGDKPYSLVEDCCAFLKELEGE